ncbi:hypothetical protein PHISP_07797 [Aspergillus sp. HF37]|nr:hypothetical protein PHISP_07797 [Aspergillus sp. HF37]
MNFLSLSENCLSRNAERIRFELSDPGDTGRSSLEHPSLEDWAIFSIAPDGKSVICGLFDDQSAASDNASFDVQSASVGEDDNEALQTAIVKLVKETNAGDHLDCNISQSAQEVSSLSLRQRFDRAMSHCHHDADFIGAHYWWNASQQLLRCAKSSPCHDDSWILEPMHSSSTRSLDLSRSVIDRWENDFVTLDRTMQCLQRTVKEVMATVSKLRNKMWFLTDVKNSMRYEDAKNVALALKTMIYSACLGEQDLNERRPRGGRSLGGSLLQKPELQVMNVMKAASSQGGPNKLSDDQVDLTRKWLSHNNIDNFCRGEERIHRFCYEVKTSINRLVGETMAEAPVLWASELFQKERAKYEGHGRGFLGLSSSSNRPFSAAGDDSTSYASSLRASDAISRYSQDIPSLARKSSFQSMMSDKWRSPRDFSAADTSSVGGSPGRAASTSTGDSCSTFWSTPQQPTYYAASASSLYSRPPSMFSDTAPQPPRRNDRKMHGKQVFLDELRQTLTSLLLSDLGSPVWSCGSETDAWFASALDQKRIRAQMEKGARIQRFYDEYYERSSRQTVRVGGRRSRSLEPPKRGSESLTAAASERAHESGHGFSYGTVFRQLMEIFSRHGSPFVKLKALRDLRALVIASLNSHDAGLLSVKHASDGAPEGSRGRRRRSSFSENRSAHASQAPILRTPASVESIVSGSQQSGYPQPTDSQIVDALKRLLLEIKPKTLFRDLQFISAFVSSDKLNKADSGTAFLQFGLAALGLKDEVCNSMVEIADAIVSQELSRRHPPAGYDMNLRRGNAIEDAAGMWIITAKEGNAVAQRELAILYLTHPELLPRVTQPLTQPRDTFKAEMMYRRDKDSKTDPQSMCLALHWMQLSANGGDELARNRLREREEFESIA